jgi:hypothetical protein
MVPMLPELLLMGGGWWPISSDCVRNKTIQIHKPDYSEPLRKI